MLHLPPCAFIFQLVFKLIFSQGCCFTKEKYVTSDSPCYPFKVRLLGRYKCIKFYQISIEKTTEIVFPLSTLLLFLH